jgi:hypothetical protein
MDWRRPLPWNEARFEIKSGNKASEVTPYALVCAMFDIGLLIG